MRNALFLAAALTAFGAPAFAQTSPAHPVMPAPRQDDAPVMNPAPPPMIAPPLVPEGRAAAPNPAPPARPHVGAKGD